jgi:hypothetical protein
LFLEKIHCRKKEGASWLPLFVHLSGMLNKTFNLVNFPNQLINRFADRNIPLQLLKLILYIKPSPFPSLAGRAKYFRTFSIFHRIAG